jgi:hypothetical protein
MESAIRVCVMAPIDPHKKKPKNMTSLDWDRWKWALPEVRDILLAKRSVSNNVAENYWLPLL